VRSMFILAYITDFFFQAKVSETARRVGVPVSLVTSESRFELELKQNPSLIIVDLAADGIDCVALVAKSKNVVPGTPVVAFGAHVKAELLEKAAEAGALALPRSKFSRQLPEILMRAGVMSARVTED